MVQKNVILAREQVKDGFQELIVQPVMAKKDAPPVMEKAIITVTIKLLTLFCYTKSSLT